MDINITVLACLKFIPVHEKLAVKLLVQLIEDQTSLGRHQCTVRVCIAFVTNVADRLALCINLIHHMDKVLLIVPVIPITFGHGRIYLIKRTLHDIVHLRDRDAVLTSLLCLLLGILTDKRYLLLCKTVHDTAGRLIHSGNDLVHIKFFFCAVFLDNVHGNLLQFYYILCISIVFYTNS